MLFKSNINIIIVIIFLLSCPSTLFAKEVRKQCGKSLFVVNVFNRNNDSLKKFKLYGQTNNEHKKLLYTTTKGSYFFIVCVKNKNGPELLLFQEIKGLNYGPEDTYGVFDPNTLEMIVNPVDFPDGNQKQIKKLIGYQPPFLNGYDGGFFCCFKD